MKAFTKNIYLTLKVFTALSVLMYAVHTNADDTEVFYSVNVSKPNLLFVLDNSGSMGDNLSGGTATAANPSRMTVLQQAVQQVLIDAPDNVNVGLMRFGPSFQSNERWTSVEGDRTHGLSGVAFPLTDINAKAREVIPTTNDVYGLGVYPTEDEQVRSYASRVVNNWSAGGGTPLVGALYEAALYYRGEQMRYGYDSPSGAFEVGAHPSTYNGGDIANNITNDMSTTTRDYTQAPNYKSPIVSSCQSNYIVLMSDGQPTYYYSGGADTQGVPFSRSRGPLAQIMQGNTGFSNLAENMTACNTDSPSTFTAGKCGPELTRYIADNDNIPNQSASTPDGLDDVQEIRTYTIGFGANMPANEQNYLRSLETIDDDPETSIVEDGYFSATDPASLAAAFADILDDISQPKGTLASPGYSVNVKSGLEHEKDIYIPVFDRKNTSRWSGNLKKFRIADVNDKRVIQGQGGINALDELGGFTVDAHDLWSTNSTPDGKDILKGGLANKLTNPGARNLFSNLTTNVNLSATENLLVSDNANVNNVNLAIDSNSTPAQRNTLIEFIRGWEDGVSGGTARNHMGDMLHSEPYVFTYTNSGGSKKQYIFAATNEGYIHAFDTETGDEKWAFMPEELLKNVESQILNEGTAIDHKYGIDGAINVWHDDKNNDGEVNGTDTAYMYFGLRRGGRSYYALDITSPDAPKFKWKVSDTDTGFGALGQSWSIPYLAKVGLGQSSTAREVVIISGGYDPIEDRDFADDPGIIEDASKDVSTTMGHDVFVLDAKSGVRLWSLRDKVSTTQIDDSIPGGMRILDTNYNGLVDRMYFADTGGSVWRLDLDEKIGAGSDQSTLSLLADLGEDGADGVARKFFNEPDVALMKLKGKSIFMVSIGSGFRAHPLDKTINDQFFMLVDDQPYYPIDDSEPYPTINISDDLAHIDIGFSGGNATIGLTGSIQDSGKRGWKVSFPEVGEKVLATSLAFDGVMTFTTLVPEALLTGVGIDQCKAPAIQGVFYGINVLTGKAGLPLVEVPDTWLPGQPIPDLNIRTPPISKEPPGKPQVVFNALDVNAAAGTCKHPVDIRIGKKLSQVTGYNACRLESVYWSDPVVK